MVSEEAGRCSVIQEMEYRVSAFLFAKILLLYNSAAKTGLLLGFWKGWNLYIRSEGAEAKFNRRSEGPCAVYCFRYPLHGIAYSFLFQWAYQRHFIQFLNCSQLWWWVITLQDFLIQTLSIHICSRDIHPSEKVIVDISRTCRAMQFK